MAATEAPQSGTSRYLLRFPVDLDAMQVTAWLHSLSGLLPGGLGRLWGAPTVVLELRSSAEHGFQYRLIAPRTCADYVVGQLRVQLPGVRVTPEQGALMAFAVTSSAWSRVVELGTRQLDRSLRVEAAPLVSTLLASLQGFALHRGETILMQWIIRPAVPEAPPPQQTARPVRVGLLSVSPHVPVKDALADRRAKLSSVNFMAVLRVGVKAASDVRADRLLGQVRAALKSTGTAANGLYVRTAPQSHLRRALDTAKVPVMFHMQLTAAELTGLLAWPIGSPSVAGLPQARSRHLPPSGEIPRSGLVVAQSNFPGVTRPLALSYGEVCKHLHVVGPIGSGKTVVLGNLVAQAMRHGNPVIVMERKGDLFRAALDAVPSSRLDDVIVMDMTDEHSVGYNLLSEGNPRLAVEEICQLFEYLYPDMRRGIWARAALHRGLMTLITRPGSSFIDLVPLLSPGARSDVEQQWRDELIAEVTDPELKRFWERFDGLSTAQQENYGAPILDRVWQLNERPEIRNVIGQSESSFTMREAIRSCKVLLVNLGGLGAETGRLAGTLLLNAIWSAVRSGACDPAKPTFLFLDEFQDFLNLPVDPESMLVQARSFGLAMVLAHQHLEQLPEGIRSAVLANARSKVVFQTTYDDARVFAREFGRSVTDEDFMNLGRFEILCRFATGEGISAPVSAVTLKPVASTALTDEAQERSRMRYGRDPADIAADIVRRRTPRKPPVPKKRPRLGGTTWG
jgi:hypothetical protein